MDEIEDHVDDFFNEADNEKNMLAAYTVCESNKSNSQPLQIIINNPSMLSATTSYQSRTKTMSLDKFAFDFLKPKRFSSIEVLSIFGQ